MFCCCHWLGFQVFFIQQSQNFSQLLSIEAGDVFDCLQRINTHKRAEIVCFVFFRELIVDFRTQLEQIFDQFEFFWIPVKDGHCCCEGFGQFRDSIDVVVRFGRVVVSCQMLKGQQNLVCFTFRISVFTAELWLTCGVRILLFSWRRCKGALGNFFLNSCLHVMNLVLLWIIYITRVASREHRFRTGIAYGFFELLFLDIPGTATEQVPTCGFRQLSSSLDRAPKMRDSVRLNSLESFLRDPPFNFLRK